MNGMVFGAGRAVLHPVIGADLTRCLADDSYRDRSWPGTCVHTADHRRSAAQPAPALRLSATHLVAQARAAERFPVHFEGFRR